jgi:DNA topoisomerase-1
MSYDEKHILEGIHRKKSGDAFIYYYVDTNQNVSQKDLDRIQKLKIPPAWRDVWVARDPESTIQAVGTDSKGRKQYRYHQVHIQKAEKEKFLRLNDFIRAMPKLEHQMQQDNQLPFYYKDKIRALMLQIVRDHQLRVGKEVYARTNKSYGISSLRKKHVTIDGNIVYLRFKGKSNQRLNYAIRDEYYVDSIKTLMKLEGDALFQYVETDEHGFGKIKRVTDTDLNDYIQEHMGQEFSIKDFRTYGANLYFIKALLSETRARKPKNRAVIKKNLMNAFKVTAKQLKHTGAVSKKSYVMNFAIELYQNSPEFFTQRKNSDPRTVLLELLQMYKINILDD